MKFSIIAAIFVSIVFLVVMGVKACNALDVQYKALSDTQQTLYDANM